MRTASVLTAILAYAVSIPTIYGAAQKSTGSEPPDPERALGCVRTINTAEVTYASTYNKGYSRTLAAMGMTPGWTKPTPDAAGLIDDMLTSGKMAGYIFNYKPGERNTEGRINAYTVTARPLQWRKGVVNYFTDQTGVIRWTKEDRAPTAKDPTIDSLKL